MTNFRNTDAADDFVATADSRETSKEVMEAIVYFAKSEAEAVALWEGDAIGDAADLTDIWEKATGNGRLSDDDLFWGGRTLAEIMANAE